LFIKIKTDTDTRESAFSIIIVEEAVVNADAGVGDI
jgi:hypothetical protein